MFAIRKRRVTAQSEIFAEIGMTARLLAWQASAIFPSVAGCLNGVNDSRIARAAANMTRKSLLDRFAIVRAALPQHGRRTHDDSGYAETALNPAFLHEGFAQHISHVFRDAF